MEQKRLDLYTFSERQLILLNTCINAWRGAPSGPSCICRAGCFTRKTWTASTRSYRPSPAQYDEIMERYYGIQLIVGAAAAGSPLYRYYAAYLDSLDRAAAQPD